MNHTPSVVPFGTTPAGEPVSLITLTNNVISCQIITYGAAIRSLFVPDRSGAPTDVVLGYDTLDEYMTHDVYLGATIGRFANRIAEGHFKLNGKNYSLSRNNGDNHLHGGKIGFSHRVWKIEQLQTHSVVLTLTSPDGEEGYPGNLAAKVTYAVRGSSLFVRYQAVSDADTPCSLTNHSYFNLAGHEKVDAAMDQVLTIPGRFFNPDDAENIPTGELRSVEGTPMDFRSPKAIRQDIGADYEPLHLQGGYDHNWEVYCNPCAVLHDPLSGRTMEVHTDCPGIQFYAGNFLDEQGKGGIYYGKRTGVALETQFYPDCLHHPGWPQPIAKAGEPFRSETVYKFV